MVKCHWLVFIAAMLAASELRAVELHDSACVERGRAVSAQLIERLPGKLKAPEIFDGVFEITNNGAEPITFDGYRTKGAFRIERPSFRLEVQDTNGVWHVGAVYSAGSFDRKPDRFSLSNRGKKRVTIRVGTSYEMLPTEERLATPLKFRMMIVSETPIACIFSENFSIPF